MEIGRSSYCFCSYEIGSPRRAPNEQRVAPAEGKRKLRDGGGLQSLVGRESSGFSMSRVLIAASAIDAARTAESRHQAHGDGSDEPSIEDQDGPVPQVQPVGNTSEVHERLDPRSRSAPKRLPLLPAMMISRAQVTGHERRVYREKRCAT